MITKYDNILFLENIPFLTRMMHNWTKTITRKNEDDQKFQNIIQEILSMVMYI